MLHTFPSAHSLMWHYKSPLDFGWITIEFWIQWWFLLPCQGVRVGVWVAFLLYDSESDHSLLLDTRRFHIKTFHISHGVDICLLQYWRNSSQTKLMLLFRFQFGTCFTFGLQASIPPSFRLIYIRGSVYWLVCVCHRHTMRVYYYFKGKLMATYNVLYDL